MWKDYIYKDEVEKICNYNEFKDKCEKDILKIEIQKMAFAIAFSRDEEFMKFLVDYLYENKNFVINKIKKNEGKVIPFLYGYFLSFLSCETKEDIKKFLTKTCGSMLRDFLSIIFCSYDVFETSFKEIENMLEDEKDILEDEDYKEVFVYELTSLIKEKPGYLNKI